MLKFYIERRSELGGALIKRDEEFESVGDLEHYLAYNRAYITKIQTLEGEPVGDED